MRRAAALAAVLLALAPALARAAPTAPAPSPLSTATTAGATKPDPNAVISPPSQIVAPAGHRLTGEQAKLAADKVPKIADLIHRHPEITRSAFLKGTDRWQVSYYGHKSKEIGQVTLYDANSQVIEAWTGFQVAWSMARGYPGAFGRRINSLYVWLPMLALFCAPFLRPRRWRSLIHLDLAVLCALSISLAFFNHGKIGLSVPLVYPVLLYLLGRMAWVGFRGGHAREPLRLLIPAGWLAVGIVFLMGFRIGLNVTNSNVIDVGYSGVIGGHKIIHGEPLYGHFPKDDAQGDTYGAVNYLAYVPFVAALGWSGSWDDLPAAHGAAVFFDVMTLLALFLLGRRVRGPTLGAALAWAWAAYPFTAYAAETNANDSLVALLVVVALLAASSAPARGVAVAVAGFTKFAPLALAPLFLRRPGDGALRPRDTALYLAGFLAAVAVIVFAVDTGEGLRGIYDRTLGFQASRGSPFSIWGFYGWHGAQVVVQVAAVLFGLALAFVPAERTVPQVAALAAAVLIAFQLGVTHWFYLYVVWFFPLVMLALLGRDRPPEPAPARSPTRTAVAVPT